MKRTQSGFTIVELLIVIVVIGILAAISIVAYNGIQERANRASVQSDVRGLAQVIEAHRVTEGALPVGDGVNNDSAPAKIKYKVNRDAYRAVANLYYCASNTAGDERYGIVAIPKTGDAVGYTPELGLHTYTGSTNQSGGICPGLGFTDGPGTYNYFYGRTGGGAWFNWTNG